jgi:hypothetical protein
MEGRIMFERLNLQLFNEKPATLLDDSYEDVIVEEIEDGSVEEIEEDEVVDEEDDVEEEDIDTEEEIEEDVEENSVDDNDTSVKFDKTQQKALNRIVQQRLERQEGKLLKEFSDVAGTDLNIEEVGSASRLWGLLKTNPDLSRAIDQVIDQHLRSGKAVVPEAKQISTKEVELEVKEAILDLKLADKNFNKNSDKILRWAEDQGFDVVSKKSLQLAYMAWKGSQAKVVQATQKIQEQKKQATKKAVRQKAAVQGGKSSKSKGKVDYARLSDSDVLASEGLSLFVDD